MFSSQIKRGYFRLMLANVVVNTLVGCIGAGFAYYNLWVFASVIIAYALVNAFYNAFVATRAVIRLLNSPVTQTIDKIMALGVPTVIANNGQVIGGNAADNQALFDMLQDLKKPKQLSPGLLDDDRLPSEDIDDEPSKPVTH